MRRLTNTNIAEHVASFTGCAIMLTGLISTVPEVVFAVGFSIVFLGIGFSGLSSTCEIPVDERLPYTVLWFILNSALIGTVCYCVWPFAASIEAILYVLTVAVAIWVTTYKVTRRLLRDRPDTIQTTDKTNAEV